VQLPETVRPQLGSQAQARLYGSDHLSGGARLRQLADAADRLTRTYEARYVLDGALAAAPLGATVTVRLAEDGTGQSAGWQVPVAAVFDAGKGAGVWVVSGNPARVAWRHVQVRGIGDDMARVEGELKTGDRVIALGAHLLHDGDAVRVDGAPQMVASAAGMHAGGAQ
jgi:multidrug efflux pump subunit AcrA (membrane-fusion protein)